MPRVRGMSELAEFVRRGSSRITPRVVKEIYRNLPLIKVEIAELKVPAFPHLIEQLQFLANVVEDYVDDKADDLPYSALAAAAFAIIYNRRELDLIPDTLAGVGMVDDSAVARAVLIEHERALSTHAEETGVNWRSISLDP